MVVLPDGEREQRIERLISVLQEHGPMSLKDVKKLFKIHRKERQMLDNDPRVTLFPKMKIGMTYQRRCIKKHKHACISSFGVGKKSRLSIYSFYTVVNDERIIDYIVSKVPWRIDTRNEANSVTNSLRRTQLTTCQIVRIVMALGHVYGRHQMKKYARLCDEQ